MFVLKQKLIYPSYGLTEVSKIEIRMFNNKPTKVYILKCPTNNMTIMLPEHTVKSVGVRPVVSQSEAKEVMDFLKNGEVPKASNSSWNKRYREYLELVKTGELKNVAKVYRYLLKQKDLSFGERKMLDYSKELLEVELAESLNVEFVSISDNKDIA